MKNKAVFLDRDGVLNRERGDYTYKSKDFEWVPDAVEALCQLSDRGYLLIIISNQGGISKGIYTKSDVKSIEDEILRPLNEKGISLTDSYYCPHHSDFENCLCRKPKSLLLEKAIARYAIAPEESYFIGDSERDIKAGEEVGVKGILMLSNDSLLLAVKEIIHD